MSKKLYGSLNNRFEENHNYNDDHLIHEGDDITKYLWSDRTCYYVTRVIDQKHIFVKPYHVCADHHKEGGMGHQNWLYFKTCKEMHEYLNKCIDEGLIPCEKQNLDEIKEDHEEEWVFRYNKWKQVIKTDYLGNPLPKPQYVDVGNISFGVRNYYYDWEF